MSARATGSASPTPWPHPGSGGRYDIHHQNQQVEGLEMASNKRRMVELSMVPPLANELGNQIDGVKPKSGVRLMSESAPRALAIELVRQMNAGVGNPDRLSQAGMVPRLAREVA